MAYRGDQFLEEVLATGTWQDFYRRVHSKDTIELGNRRGRNFPTSGFDATGFVKVNSCAVTSVDWLDINLEREGMQMRPFTAGEGLHAAIFGRHFHNCPSARCVGKPVFACSQVDCQPGPQTCADCCDFLDERAHQRAAWRQVDKLMKAGIMV